MTSDSSTLCSDPSEGCSSIWHRRACSCAAGSSSITAAICLPSSTIVSGDVDDTADRPAQPGVIEHIGVISPLRTMVVISAKGWSDGHLINPRIDDIYGVCRNQ